ncbi:hypothetical protein E3O42_10880 [Cryobacterium adonitolivorans]|uniref:Glycosyltransferase RgtA/B/C/D-like domain-containing protein n=1 Tax=Cryobacterium adonitolivorans TaxID=1259189 RepID=A0A4R8W3F9_9MICO|nr:hypothetical protein E3O42_10880 [Cryobacterium adonitolivorans]
MAISPSNAGATERRDRTVFASTAAVIALAATLVSLAGSWIPSLWGDEAASIMSASRSIPSLVAMLGTVDAVHGAYYLGLHAWIAVFGASPFSVRLPSALAVGITVAAVMVIARRLGNVRVAVAAGVICAVIPRVTYMGSETRSSAFAAAIVAWLTVVLLSLLGQQTPARRWWVAYGVLLTVGIYVFIYIVLIIIAHALILLSVEVPRRRLIGWVKTVTVAVAATLPVFVWAVLERGQVTFLGHRNEITPYKLLVSLWFGQPLFAVVAWTLLVLALVAGTTIRLRGPQAPLATVRLSQLSVLATSWLLVPAVLLIGGSSLVPVYTARYLSYCAPAASLLMAIGLDWVTQRRPRAMAAGLLVIVLCATPAWLAQRQPIAKNNSDFAQTSAIIAAHAVPGDAIAFDESVRPSRRPRLALHLYPTAFVGLNDVTLQVPYQEGTSWHDLAYSLSDAATLGRFDGVHRLWLIERSNGGTPDTYGQATLAALGYTAVHRHYTHRSVIFEYVDRRIIATR